MSTPLSFDVCFIYETRGDYQGTDIYPLVQDLCNGIPDTTFALISINTGNSQEKNVRFVQEEVDGNLYVHINLHSAWKSAKNSWKSRRAPALPAANQLIQALYSKNKQDIAIGLETLQDQLEPGKPNAHAELLYSKDNWDALCASYDQNAQGTPFQDYLHLYRTILAPLYAFSGIIDDLPAARCYHTLSSGYAGYLGTVLQRKHDTALVCSDYGSQALPTTIGNTSSTDLTTNWQSEHYRSLWLRLRAAMNEVAYKYASVITATSAHQLEKRRQQTGNSVNVLLIPNGIDCDYFFHLFSQHSQGVPNIVATIGPVEAAQDTKGFIRSLSYLREKNPNVVGWVVGSLQEDPHYAKECRSLVRNLGLYNHLRFFGQQDASTIYPRLGALVITSLTDTPPSTLHQAQAAGVPVVVTDTGSSRELITGRNEQDRQLGSSGAVVSVADPAGIADAVYELLKDQQEWTKTRLAGVERVHRYYSLESMVASHDALYRKLSRAA